MARKWKLSLIFLICFCVKGIQGGGGGCSRTVTCGFEGHQACGFSGDATWKLHGHSPGSNGSYALFQWKLSSGGDMASPTLCNGEISVQFSCVVLLQPTELHVLTQCNDRDLSPQPLHGIAGPVTSWRRFNFSLPACPTGQIQQVVFRAVHAHTTSQKIALDDVRIETMETLSTKHHVTNQLTTTPGIQGGGGGCNRTVTCGFEGHQACGFSGDATWKLHGHSPGSNGSYALFQWKLSSGGDMASPTLCNGEISVQFSCVVLLQPTELHVLTQCNDRDLSPQPLHGVAGPMTSWKRFNFSLPACPTGQIQQVVFRAVHAHTTSQKIALDDVRIETNTSHVPTRCSDTVSCQFEGTDCGFRGSFNWRLEKSSSGGYERFEHNGGVSTTDLVSPMLCGNAETYVEFSCKIITPGFTFGRPAELHVLVTCNDVELRHQPLHGVRGPWTSWKPFNWTLPACPKGQTPRIVFRAVYASTGSVILLDNVHLQSNAPTTTLVSTLSTKTIARHSHTTTKSSSQHGVVRSSTRPTATTSVLRQSTTTTRPKSTTSTSPKTTTSTRPKSTTTTPPKSTTSTSPKSTTSTRPKSTTTTPPKSTTSTSPTSPTTTQLKSTTSTSPGPTTTTRPTSTTSTSPTATTSTRPTSPTTTRPTSPTTTRPTSTTTTRPKSTTTTRPKSTTSTSPRPMTSTSPTSTTSTSPTSTTSTSPTSTTSTSPTSTTSTSPTSTTSTSPTATTSTSPTATTSTSPTATSSTRATSTTSTGPTSTTSTHTTTTSTQPKSTTSTPNSTTSTQPKSTTSTQPKSTTSTQPKSTTSTPKSTTSTPTSTTSTGPSSTTSTHTATTSTQPKSTTSTPTSSTSTPTVATSAQPKSTTSTATATASTQPAVTKSASHIITSTSTRPATHSATTKSPEHRPSSSQNPGGNEGTAGPQSGNGSDDKEKLTIGVAVGVCGAVLLLVVVVVYIVYRRRHLPSDRQPLSSDYLDDEDLGILDDTTIKMSQTLTDPNSDC